MPTSSARLVPIVFAASLAWALGCGAPGSASDGGGTDGETTGTDTGTTGEGTAGTSGGATDPPKILSFEVKEVPDNPLALEIEVLADRTVTSTVTVEPIDAPADAEPGNVGCPQPAEACAIPLTGLHADATYHLTLTVEDGAGATAMAEATVTVAPLPATLPPLVTTGRSGEPGAWTFFNVMRWLGPGFDAAWGYVLAVDAAGHPVWVRFLPQSGDVSFADDGSVVVQVAAERALVLDRLGRDIAPFVASDLSPAIDTMHHEILPKEDGTYATLSTELRTIDGYDDGMGGQTAYDVVGDVLVEFDATGAVTWEISLFDVLADAVHRVRPGFHAPFWDPVYADVAPSGTTKDWTHGNALVYSADGTRVLVSLRTQDWIVTLDRVTGEVLHRLGPEGDFALIEGDWFYHQHAPELLPDGALAVYDNGNTRPGTGGAGEPPRYSRVVVYDLDEDAMEATERWSHVAEDGGYAPFLGDVDVRPDGSVLVTDGGLVGDPDRAPNDPANPKFARISEVTTDGTVRFRLDVGGPDAGTSFSVYRAERVAGGYDFAASSSRSTRRPRQ
ncbi:MAG: hypothetical protein D6705_13530 [Deltaproteobacteria bacterium]|nr:MAG: hypothetical protein D6705_13530 [Deltaproteobacteria bacterium]